MTYCRLIGSCRYSQTGAVKFAAAEFVAELSRRAERELVTQIEPAQGVGNEPVEDLPQCTAHGLKKAAATICAQMGAPIGR